MENRLSSLTVGVRFLGGISNPLHMGLGIACVFLSVRNPVMWISPEALKSCIPEARKYSSTSSTSGDITFGLSAELNWTWSRAVHGPLTEVEGVVTSG